MNSKTSSSSQEQMRKPRPQAEQALKCPRCDSTNTKFCYYNNYSLSQPRYFCKSCRRYWTQGGTLRNVPVGGGCRKNKRSSSSSSSTTNSSSSSFKKPQDHPFASAGLPHFSYDHQPNDLFARLHKNSGGPPTFNDFDLSVLGMSNGDVLNGNFGYNNSQGMYYGSHHSNNMGGGVEMGGGYDQDHHHDHNHYSNATTTTAATTVTTMKQELFGGREMSNEQSKMVWGYQNWEMNNGNGGGITAAATTTTDHHHSNMMMGMDFDSVSARESWNNAFTNASSWHGLLNTPLM